MKETLSKDAPNLQSTLWIVLKPNANVPATKIVQQDFLAKIAFAKTSAQRSCVALIQFALLGNVNALQDMLTQTKDANLKAVGMMVCYHFF